MKKNNPETTHIKKSEPMFEPTLKTAIETASAISFKSPRYVVTRDGYRVSDREYSSNIDENAIYELEFWYKIANIHSYGEKVEIVQYDPKRHRVW